MAVRRVAVTGIGIVSPLGTGAKRTWDALLSGSVGTRHMVKSDGTLELAGDLPRVAAPVDKSSIAPPPGDEAIWSRVSPFIHYALIAAAEALSEAQYKPTIRCQRERSGCYIGTGIGCLEEIINAWKTLSDPKRGLRRLSPHFVPKILGNLATGNVSIRYGLEGPNHACITACASGAHAIGDSYRMIKYGDADVMLTGGTEACINEVALAGFARLRALSTRFQDNPTCASRPFDVDRDGFVMGEGAALLVLEELEHAHKRGAEIIAEVIGYGMAGDAHHITAPSPDGRGALRSMQAALCNANLPVEELDHVNAHATSTPVGDGIEGRAISDLIQEGQERRQQPLLVNSTKGATGVSEARSRADPPAYSARGPAFLSELS